MTSILLEQITEGWFKGIASIIGRIMAFIHETFHIPNVTITIVIITVIIYMLLLPLTYKQQKFSKLSQKVNPEIQKLQEKYKGKTDEVSRMKMNNEMQAIYDKYGISPMGSCLPLLIQMPILFAMFTVIRNMSVFISGNSSFLGLDIQKTPLENIGAAGVGLGETISIYFKGITSFDLAVIVALLIPILSGVTQWISVKVSMSGQKIDNSNPAMASMRMMNTTMPIISTIMVFSFPVGLGLYWTLSAVVRSIQQFVLNKHFDRLDFDKIVEKNREKAAAKQAKREGYLQSTIAQSGRMNTRNLSTEDREETLEKANQARSNAKPGSMASKANLVRDYNEKNTK